MNINATLILQSIAMMIFVWFCMKFLWPPLLKIWPLLLLAAGLPLLQALRSALELAQMNLQETPFDLNGVKSHLDALGSGLSDVEEIVAGILHRDPTTTLEELLGSEALFGAQVVEHSIEDQLEQVALLHRPREGVVHLV